MYKTDIFLDNLYKMKTRISNLNFLLTSILIENVFLWGEMGTNTGRMFAMRQARAWHTDISHQVLVKEALFTSF